MPIVIDVAVKMEKVMAFLVEAGYTYAKLLDFKPSAEDKMKQDWKGENATRDPQLSCNVHSKGHFRQMET